MLGFSVSCSLLNWRGLAIDAYCIWVIQSQGLSLLQMLHGVDTLDFIKHERPY